MSETAKNRAARFLEQMNIDKRKDVPMHDVRHLLHQIKQAGDEASGSRAPICVDELRRGDVFIAKLVGGKTRPWIVLRVVEEVVTAVPMSSGESAPNMTRSLCRLWPNNWIGSTVSQFSLEDATREVTRPYTDRHHLTRVEREIYHRLGATVNGPSTIAEIREKIPA